MKKTRFLYSNYFLYVIKQRAIKQIPLIKKLIIFVIYFLLSQRVFSQSPSTKDTLLRIVSEKNNENIEKPIERIYLQFDKPYYAIGDTIWFKAYLFNTAFFTPSVKSGIIYVDVANDSNKVVKQYRFPVQADLSWGNISLDKKEFTPGTYTLRAYTSWMRNWDDDYFFYKQFYVGSADENNWLINSQFNATGENGNQKVNARLMFSDMNKKPLILTALDLQVMNGSRHLYKQKMQTGIDGSLNINFNVPQKNQGIAIIAETTQKDRKAVIPVSLNRIENTDIQFLPEGGNFIVGLPAHIGFKAIGEDGKGINVSGIIIDHAQQQIAIFKSLHNGMGSFDLTAKDAENYKAKVTLPGGLIKEYPLPVVKNSGTVLHVKNEMGSDSVEVIIRATNDIAQTSESYFLIGKARGIVCYAAIVNFHEGNLLKRKIAKSLFPTGITHFTLLTTNEQPLNERLVFINHKDNLNIQLTADKSLYTTRDSIALHLKVTGDDGKPVAGNFSLAVTDDAQVKTDTLNNENILCYFLFTSDLKGYVEEPGYYFLKTDAVWVALDDLLLTQGWIGYNNRQQTKIKYEAENKFKVSGKVVTVFNKPVKGTKVQLFSKSPIILRDTLTDNNGRFIFNNFPRVDTPIFVIQSVNKSGKSFNVSVNVDEIMPPTFVKPTYPAIAPWYVNSDTTLLRLAKSDAMTKQLLYLPKNGHLLNEVKIIAEKIVKDSQNLNGSGNADQVIDEKELETAGKKTWLQLFQENIKGFREGSYDYLVKWKPVIIIIDGILLTRVVHMGNFNDLRSYLQSHTAEDIKGIEFNFSDKYTSNYEGRFLYPPFRFAFIEITTRSGHGPIIDNTPGMYLYKPLPISYPKQFYKPKYTVNDTTKHIADLRSTIDWEPNITTDANGEAKISFYTADKPSTYTLIIEGSDMNGNLGYKREKIKVDNGKTGSK